MMDRLSSWKRGLGLALVISASACASSDEQSEAPQPGDGSNAAVEATIPLAADGLLDPNTVDAALLAGLPGLNPELAEAVIGARPLSAGSLDHVLDALDDATKRALYARLFVPIELNTASDSDILAIPGVGPRMLHEFKEYRPYASMAQFRRDIGKYVGDEELSRLERYVRLKSE
jgi:DNA uptake protein ComE-like DNA-binding protein